MFLRPEGVDAIKRVIIAMVLLALGACGGSESADGSGGAETAGDDLSAFCAKGARIGDTSVLTDVDSGSPETYEETYNDAVETLEELVETAPEEARPTIEAGYEILLEFRSKLESAGWEPTKLSLEDQSRFINLSQELVDVSPAIREACP